MENTPTELPGSSCPRKVVEIMATSLGLEAECFRTISAHRLNQSIIYRIQIASEAKNQPSELFTKVRGIESVKTNRAWEPRAEFLWMKEMAINGSAEATSAQIPKPVAFGEDPAFLACEFFHGEPLHVYLKPLNPEFASRAIVASSKVGRWLRESRSRSLNCNGKVDFRELFDELLIPRKGLQGLVQRQLIPLVLVIERLFLEYEKLTGSSVGARWSCHGDLIPLNILLGHQGAVAVVDFELAHYSDMSDDVWQYRLYLEQTCLNSLGKGHDYLSLLWKVFWRSYAVSREDQFLESAIYCIRLHRHLRHLSTLASMKIRGVKFVRDTAWFGWRIRWIKKLPRDPAEVVRYIGGGL